MAVVRPGWDPGPPHRPNPRALPAHVHVAGFIDFIISVTLLTYFASTSVVSLRGTFAATTRPHVAVTEKNNSNGIIAHTVRPLTAAATSRPSATATTPKSYPTPIRGQRYKLELFGKSIINDMMGVRGAAAAACASRPAIAIPKPPLRARFHCTGPNHHDGHYEDNDMYTCFHPEPSCHAGREL